MGKRNQEYTKMIDMRHVQATDCSMRCQVTEKSNVKFKNNLIQCIKIYHQNICGLQCKVEELVASLYPDIPHVMCISEHHLNHMQIQLITMDEYKRCTEYCRQSFQKGGVCMYILKSLTFTTINLTKYCKDKDLEACAIKLKLATTYICILYSYYLSSTSW
jgi:exonuclease III